jgi:hypothetical protein
VAERVAVDIPVTFEVNSISGKSTFQGTLINLSSSGCKIVSVSPPDVTANIVLELRLTDGKAPLRITSPSIAWAKGTVFAVRFPKLEAEQRKSLQEIILKHLGTAKTLRERAAFRIA